MREIRMKSISSGPDHSPRHIGKVYPVDDGEAALLVKGGYAEYAAVIPPEAAIVNPAEAEVVGPPEVSEERPETPGKKLAGKGRMKK